MIHRFLAFLPASIAGGAIFLTSGCLWDECGWNEYLFETWNRQLTVTENISAFPDSGLSPDSTSKPFVRSDVSVYNRYDREYDRSVASTVPRTIRLTFDAQYSSARLQSWRAAGLFMNPSADTGDYDQGQILHEIILDSTGLPAGTYAFSPTDTSAGMRVSVLYFPRYIFAEDPDTLALSDFSGTITITEAFTKNTGAFTYQIDVEYLPGQKSSFTGTASFDGVTHHKSCIQDGVVVD